jgi:8-oxo-dGTP pyrophosphatase MutT (NUDIX family)
VVLLRTLASSACEFEVLLLRRSSQLVFYGGAWVFPGGRIDAADAHDGEDLRAAAGRAAIRELAEETGLALPASELVYFARWITPKGRARRFDTFYFAAHAPAGSVSVDQGEVDAYRWMRPADALAACAARQIELPPPTFVTLTQLALHADPQAALAALRSRVPEAHDGTFRYERS